MAAAYVQSATGVSNGTGTYTLTFSSGVTAGNLIVLGIQEFNTASVTSITDNKGNTYNLGIGSPNAPNNTDIMYYAYNVNGGSGFVITINHSVTSENSVAVAQEFSGLITSNPFDQSSDAGGNPAGPTGTTSVTDELIVGFFGTNANSAFTVGSGYSNFINAGGGGGHACMESKVEAAIGTYSAAATQAFPSNGCVATFMPTLPATTTSTSSTSTSSTSISTSSTSTSISSTSTSTSTTTVSPDPNTKPVIYIR